MKYAYMTRFSILAVIVIFLSQAFLVYRLFQANVDLLQRELNLVTESVYNADLNSRLASDKNIGVPDIKYFGSTPPPGVDTTSIRRISTKDMDKELNGRAVSIMTLAMEEFAGMKHPINLKEIDSLAAILLTENGINLKFYSEIVDVKSDTVIETSLHKSVSVSNVLSSKGIPLDLKQNKELRLVVINPMWKIYPQMAWMLVLSLLLSIFCVYSLHIQKKTLAKQRKLANLKNDFFSEVSHEFKQPLAVLSQSMTSLSNEKILLNEEKRTRMLRIVGEEIAKMTSRTEMFLSLAQDDEGLFELHCSEFDLVKVVFDLADRIVETAPGSPEIDVDNELKDPMIFADKNHIEEMVSNLIGNAIKYSKEERIDIHIRLYKENNDVCISVKDAGIGISAENLNIIFEKYLRVGKTSHAKGHGIGLNYVKRIAEKHGGSISVKSELNVGSEFIVSLPLVKNA
ncbi:histidine kinase/DNA gyrase B/HSP90-like ATPase [Dysgonomonas alginatilytica]|uniref:histidine kinase n=1 Tax=Dysgonomonas alginatilytica TaxID=1605892 RepID=A0A2V3PUH4_9BACT|nr:HAMP domain-containing sensor histidine kinase [Dysgonomonas alginatilytica]PXV67557.1 histidine kinase/DNA gyrase B/HSP90-like ATPase [Dysgonomonas alginatilytica]